MTEERIIPVPRSLTLEDIAFEKEYDITNLANVSAGFL